MVSTSYCEPFLQLTLGVDFLGGDEKDFFGEGNEEDDDDEDLKNDPAYTLDLPVRTILMKLTVPC